MFHETQRRVDAQLLRKLPIFSDLPEADIDRYYSMSGHIHVPAGAVLIQEGDVSDTVYIVVEGELRVCQRFGDSEVPVNILGNGEVVGEMASLTRSPRNATVAAQKPTELISIDAAVFADVLSTHSGAAMDMLRTVTTRLRNAEVQLIQHQKMAALGTLAAGLAHELNNPAAALSRSTARLRETLDSTAQISAGPESPGQHTALAHAIEQLNPQAKLDPLTRIDRESEVQFWLTDHGVERAWEVSPLLIDAGWDLGGIKRLIDDLAVEDVPMVIQWLTSGQETRKLIDEISSSATSISEIVDAVKTYTRLDEAPVLPVDIHESLEQTLIILRYKQGAVDIRREYADNLSHIMAYASELNQVWTNIIDNALAAMDGHGTITIRTRQEIDAVVVEIENDGPCIPADVQARMFDPFFTTKAPGHGAGLGLYTVYNTIVRKHNGEVNVKSVPGLTRFTVRLPITMAA